MEISDTLTEGPTYEASGLKTSFHGLVYQLKILMLYAKRANDKGMEFLLATEAESAEKFDDVVFTWKEHEMWSGRFIQVKHRLDPSSNKIKFKDLMTRKDSDFSLVKYFTSYCKVNQIGGGNNMGSKEFIVCTNTDVDLSSIKFSNIFEGKDIDREDILHMKSGKIQRINTESREFVHELKNNIKEALCGKIISNKKIKEILKDSTDILNFLTKECNKISLSRCKSAVNENPTIEWEKVGDILNNVCKSIEGFSSANSQGDCKEIKDMLTEISTITKDFENVFNDFISSLTLMTSLPGEEKLGQLIKEELGEKYNLIDVDLLNSSFEKKMLDWLKSYDHKKKQAKFFKDSDGNELFELLRIKLESLMTSGLSTAYPEKLKTKIGIVFAERFKELSEFLSSEKQIFFLTSSAPRLGAMKVLQGIEEVKTARDSCIFMRLRTLVNVKNLRKLILDTFSGHKSHDLLVLECQNKERNTVEEIILKDEILKTLACHPKKRIVLITTGDGVFEIGLQQSSLEVVMFHMKDSFKDLTVESQSKILKKKVSFQGKSNITLDSLMNINLANEIIDLDILSALIKEETIEIGNVAVFSSIGYEESYYIPRTFSYQRISKDILDDIQTKQLDSVIVFKPLKSNESASLEDAQHFEDCVVISNEALPESRDTYTKLVSIYPEKNIHWLELRSNRLAWMDSRGDLSQLQPYVRNNNKEAQATGFRDNITEEYFVQPNQLDHKVIILANDPGMGKSTVLSSLAKKIQEKTNEILWIVRIDLNDYSSHGSHCTLDNVNFGETDTDKAIDFITELIIPKENIPSKIPILQLQRKLFKATLKPTNDKNISSIRAVIMFDGFDEISPNYKTNTTILIKALKASSVAQVWITTRINEKCHLEKQFESPALVLNPFTFEDQSQFLSGMLRWHLLYYIDVKSQNLCSRSCEDIITMLQALKLNSCGFNKIVNQIDSILTLNLNHQEYNGQFLRTIILDLDLTEYNEALLKIWRYSIGDSNREFTCIPLHLRMLAEVTINQEFKLLENLPLFDLYGEFIKAKGVIFNREKAKTSLGNVAQNTKDTIFLKRLEKIHSELALRLIFKVDESSNFPGLDEMSYFEEDMEECNKNGKQEISRAGLVKFSSDGTPLFIHRSFAEYFLSEYLIRHVKKIDIQQLLLEQILFNDKYALVQEFVNGRLKKPYAAERIKLKDSPVLKDVFLKMARKGHSAILKFLIEHSEGLYKCHHSYEFLATAEDNNGNTALQLAIIWGHREAMNVLLYWVKHYVENKKNPTILKSMLLARNHHTVFYMAILLSQVEVLNTFIECIPVIECQDTAPSFEELLLDEIHSDSTTLHAAAHSSSIDVMNTFLRCVDHIVRFNNNSTLVKDLLLACDKDRKTVLHLVVINGNSATIETLLAWIEDKVQNNYLSESVLTELLTATDINRATALHYAAKARCKDNIESFLNWITRYYQTKSKVSESNESNVLKVLALATDKKGETVLHWAGKNENNIENSLEASLDLDTDKEEFDSISIKYDNDPVALNYIRGIVRPSTIPYRNNNVSSWIRGGIRHQSGRQQNIYEHPLSKEKRRATVLQNVAENGCSLNVVALLKDNVNSSKLFMPKPKGLHSTELPFNRSNGSENVKILLNWIDQIIRDFNFPNNILKEILFSTDVNGSTSLHTAARCGNNEYAEAFLSWIKNSNIDSSINESFFKELILAPDNTGSTALHKAVKEGNIEYIETLLEWTRRNIDNLCTDNKTPMTLELVLKADNLGASSFHWAAKTGNFNAINAILKNIEPLFSDSVCRRLVLVNDNKGATVLQWAAREGSSHCIETLLSSLKLFLKDEMHRVIIRDLILARDKKGATALHWAAAVGDSESVKTILSSKINDSSSNSHYELLKNLVMTKDLNKATALHWAANEGNGETIEMLLKLLTKYLREDNLDVTLIRDLVLAKDAEGASVLHWAVISGNNKSIGSLLNWLENNYKDGSFLEGLSEDLILATNYEEETSLHWAATYGNCDFAEFLLNWVKRNTSNGNIPDNTDILQRLILAKDRAEASYLHWAAICGHYKFIETLLGWLKYNINDLQQTVLENLILATNNVGATALHSAAINGCNQTIETLLNCVKNNIRDGQIDPLVLKKLLLATDRKGETVLHWAVLGEIAAYRLEGYSKNGEFVKSFMHWVKRNVIDANLPYSILNDLVIVTSQHGETSLRLFGNGSKIQTCPPWDWIRENLHEDTVDILGQMFVLPD